MAHINGNPLGSATDLASMSKLKQEQRLRQKQADNQCYLESATPRNLDYYEALGDFSKSRNGTAADAAGADPNKVVLDKVRGMNLAAATALRLACLLSFGALDSPFAGSRVSGVATFDGQGILTSLDARMDRAEMNSNFDQVSMRRTDTGTQVWSNQRQQYYQSGLSTLHRANEDWKIQSHPDGRVDSQVTGTLTYCGRAHEDETAAWDIAGSVSL